MEDKSPSGTLNKEDVLKWGKNTLVFLSPLILMYFLSVTPLIQQDGLQYSDFRITAMVAGGMVLYILNVVTDLLKKLSEGPKE